MKTAAVVLDSWKLPIFEKHLKAAGYKYTNVGDGLSAGTITLRVEYEWVAELKPIIEAAQKECAETGAPPTPMGDIYA